MYLALLLATLAALPQDPPHEPTMLERLDALIAKSNACEGFVARYKLHDADGHELALRLAYRAPSDLVVDVQSAEGGAFTCLRAQTLDWVGTKEGAPGQKASLRGWNRSGEFADVLRGLLEKELPGTLRADDLSARASPTIELSIAPDDSTIDFHFGTGTVRDARFGWLERARRRPERVSLGGADGTELVLAYTEKTNVVFSTETGFVTRIEKRTGSEVRRGLELVDLSTSSRPTDEEFELPKLGEAVQDISEDFAGFLEGQMLSGSRDELFGTLARLLDDGRLEWNDKLPEKIERVMRALHAVDFAPVCARELRSHLAVIEQASDKVREALLELDLTDPEVVADQHGQMEKGRQKLENQLGSFLEREIANGMPRGKCKARPSLYEDLAALERRILSEIFAETVTKPVLTEFDEKLGKQLEAK